ncbi:ubiquinone/menaquinone biosynthesis C-methyltransferase UbiE-like [Montipora foliosa]|uniref:ubiquinone/menaquinone biosynthesis C-methyltransferase UbiE-like n=1 Tax=Montipora foliosa TaxID=591990 RepID=UPI0035F11BFA
MEKENQQSDRFGIADHYRSVAKDYDNFYQARNEAMVPVILKYFDDVEPDHVVVDIGSGTGFFGERIFEARQLKNAIWCVDPSPEMQAVAKQRKGVYAVTKTAEEFVADFKVDQLFDKVSIIASFHHFSRPIEVLKGLRAHLQPGGEVLVVIDGDSSTGSGLPHFAKAEEIFRDTTQQCTKESISAVFRQADFKVEVSEEKIMWIVKKSLWYEMLRGRFYSTLSELSDEEIEDGIVELEMGKFKSLSPHDDVRIPFPFHVFRATKPAAKSTEPTP